jgi:hypothetical protein
MTLIRREGFVASLSEGILWYASQDEHGKDAAERLAEGFAGAIDNAIARITRNPDGGALWKHRRGYRFVVVAKPFHRWLIFYRQPGPDMVELVDLIRGERDLPRQVTAP